jgi:hypothetical protein
MSQLAIELVKQSYETGSFKNKSLEHARTLGSILNVDQMISVSLHLSQRTYTGFYSISFNQAARNIEEGFLKNLPNLSIQDYFPELYNNKKLTSTEKSILKQRHIREHNALSNAFHRALKIKNPKFFRHSDESDLEDSQMDDLYSQCYNQICIAESFVSLKDINKFTYSCPTEVQIIIEKMQTYCLPTKDLLAAIVKGTIFSTETIDKFHTELKLIEYTLNNSK